MTITLSADLKEQLDAYARAHSELYAPVDATVLVPHMLATFIARDRGFRRATVTTAKRKDAESD